MGVRSETNKARPVRAALRVRVHIIRNARIENVGKSQSCMVSKLRIICKQTVHVWWKFATHAVVDVLDQLPQTEFGVSSLPVSIGQSSLSRIVSHTSIDRVYKVTIRACFRYLISSITSLDIRFRYKVPNIRTILYIIDRLVSTPYIYRRPIEYRQPHQLPLP